MSNLDPVPDDGPDDGGDAPGPEAPLSPQPQSGCGVAWLAIGLAVVMTVGFFAWRAGQSQEPASVVAVTQLTAADLPVTGTPPAEARLLRVGDRLELELDLPELPAGDGYVELWLTDRDGVGRYSLGLPGARRHRARWVPRGGTFRRTPRRRSAALRGGRPAGIVPVVTAGADTVRRPRTG
ncbi:MAG: hypothetical protein ACK5PP_09600 [Acidimicrobiales bacterium]